MKGEIKVDMANGIESLFFWLIVLGCVGGGVVIGAMWCFQKIEKWLRK